MARNRPPVGRGETPARSRGSTTAQAAALLAMLLMAGCSLLEPDPEGVTREGDRVSGTGVVQHFALEGGFFAIRGDDRVVYEPINLPEGFHHHGLRVRFTARLRPDLGTFRMVGPVVELLEIRRR